MNKFLVSVNPTEVLLVILNPQGEIIRFSPQCEKLTGYGETEVKGEIFWDLLVPEDCGKFLKEIFNQMEPSQSAYRYECPVITKGGEKRIISWCSTYLGNGNGNIKRIVCLGKDITSLKERAKRTKTITRYKNTVGALPCPYFALDVQGRIVDWNNRLEEVFGYSGEQLSEMLFLQAFIEEDREKIGEAIQRVVKGEKVQVKGRVYTKGKEVIHTEWAMTQLVDEEDNLVGLTGLGRNFTEYKRTQEALKQSFIDLAETVSRVLGISDPYTARHSTNVATLAQKVGRRMGLDEDRCLGLYIGGLLHDIGKIAIPQRILLEPGDLSDEEWTLIRSHPKRGYEKILKKTPFPWPVGEMVLHHHERLNGSGYPDGLVGDELSREVRILGLCDVVGAMASRRPYRPPRTREEVVQVIKKGVGKKYDPEVAEIVLELIEKGEVSFEET